MHRGLPLDENPETAQALKLPVVNGSEATSPDCVWIIDKSPLVELVVVVVLVELLVVEVLLLVVVVEVLVPPGDGVRIPDNATAEIKSITATATKAKMILLLRFFSMIAFYLS